MKSTPLKVLVKDTATVGDKLVTHKPWFNGIKKFFTVKVLPPKL